MNGEWFRMTRLTFARRSCRGSVALHRGLGSAKFMARRPDPAAGLWGERAGRKWKAPMKTVLLAVKNASNADDAILIFATWLEADPQTQDNSALARWFARCDRAVGRVGLVRES